MKFFLVFIFFVIALASSAQEKIEEFEQFEIRSYTPQKSGVKDLVFEARIEGITEMLNKNLVLGKLSDVYYKIFWISPASFKIEVYGLPKGFEELKADLTSLVRNRLEFVLPEKFSDRFKGYTLKSESIADGKLIHALDATYTMAVPEIDIVMDKSGKLKTVQTRSPMSAIKTEFTHSPKSWSNNKLVLDKIVSTSKQGAALLTNVNVIDYVSVNGVGFPSRITVRDISNFTIPKTEKAKEKKVTNEKVTVIHFTQYEVNTGKAQSYLNDGQKR